MRLKNQVYSFEDIVKNIEEVIVNLKKMTYFAHHDSEEELLIEHIIYIIKELIYCTIYIIEKQPLGSKKWVSENLIEKI